MTSYRLPLCVAASLMAGALPAAAQPASLPALRPPPSASTAAQPVVVPSRVGRIAAVTGPVSFHLADATDWQLASANLPVSTGTALWVAAGGEAALGLGGGNRMVLAPSTELVMDRLDDQAVGATQPQGESYLHLVLLQPGETYTIQTPRGIVTIATAGRYEINSGDTEHPTVIAVLDGSATLSGIPTTADIGAGQILTIIGDGAATPFAPSLGAIVQDAFLRHALAEERPLPARPAHAPAIVAQMTGAEVLDEVGEWSDNAEYGSVWYPPVADYVPYRQGRWAYVAPWGWTWVDDAPWGFAPTHYGRWAQFGGRWGWVPGRDWAPDRRPVYAPALVGFLAGAALGAGRGPAVGWAPLGPHDAYRPPYAANERVVQILNQPTGATFGGVNAPVVLNRSGITVVPTQVLTTSGPVAGAFRPGPVALGPTSALQFRPHAEPTRATIGATPAVLRQVNPLGLSAPATHAGSGPGREGLGSAPGPGSIGPGGGPGVGAAVGPGPGAGPVLGGAALGAVAGGLLRGPGPHAGLPELRDRGAAPPGLAERQRPGAAVPGPSRPLPPVITPDTPRGAAPGSLYGRVPEPGRPGGPSGPRPTVLEGGPREGAMPLQDRGGPPRGEPFAGFRPEGGARPRPEGFAGPRPEGGAGPRPEGFAGPRPEGGAGPRHEGFGGPRPEGGGVPRQEQRPERMTGPQAPAAPNRPAGPQIQRTAPAQEPHGPPPGGHEGRPER